MIYNKDKMFDKKRKKCLIKIDLSHINTEQSQKDTDIDNEPFTDIGTFLKFLN